MYEFCLEYGTFPISIISKDILQDTSEPVFLQDNPQLLEDLRALNKEFHSLFVAIECNLDYIGREKPETIARIHQEYKRLAAVIAADYPDIRIEPFYLT